MTNCSNCGKKNDIDADFCSKCGNSLKNTNTKKSSFEKHVGDFAQEVEHLGKKAGKTIERGVKNLGEEVKDIGKKVEKVIQSETSSDSSKSGSNEYKRLYRSGKNRVIGGVCSGVAEYFNLDPLLVRIIWVLIVFFPPGFGLILYILLWIFIPRNPKQSWD